MTEIQAKDSITKYDDTIKIKNYSTSFNLITNDKIPDLRNLKYKTNTDHLNCPICQQPFIKPLTTICGHTFCKECIYECLKSLNNNSNNNNNNNNNNNLNSNNENPIGYCPLDRTPIDSANINDLFPTPLIVTNLIDDLKVYCLNYERGCEWFGSRWEVEHHVLEKCPYTGVVCNGKRLIVEEEDEVESEKEEDEEEGQQKVEEEEDKKVEEEQKKTKSICCKLIVERRHFENTELNECVHKLYKCEFCDEQITKITEKSHLESECLYNHKTCKLCDNDSIPEKNMIKHQENCIKTGKLKCPANEIGCSWIGSNETSLEIHLQNGNCQLFQFLPFYKNLNDKVSSLETENNFLQNQINKILDSIIQGKITNLGYNENIEEINKNFQFSNNKNLEDQDKLIYLNFEIDRLKFEINEKILPIIKKLKLNEQDNMIKNLINDNFIMREDMNLQRVMINSLRKQLQFMLFSRNRIGNNNVSNNNNGSGYGFNGNFGFQPHNGDDLMMMMPEMYESTSRSSSEERLNLKL
ncbi:uncharacterized protein KGF55_000978 [Candida pseudojiufengensis]|uniref:uncharacterized protein n=1 Tax=Candida pseudojiufengensis TaxID=497109 RepID=UPI00222531EF|nr:uncharacterized protein KGF55_000978 [Candida pseudojiufengensis]KAI5965616.1 hypothetical protein KGF55_000978 [Candida pseudojiufengensis]